MPRTRTPYLKRLERIEGVWVWMVNGHVIRDRIDVEFTNGAHHFTRAYVPADEIWLDREAPRAGEWRYWAMRQRIERALMAAGQPYLSALRTGARIERDERRLARGIPGPVLPSEVQRHARKQRLGEAQGREIWLVDGRAVRDLAYVDFTLGGHGFRYRFIPRREIWLDDAVRAAERPFILHHELVEVGLMAQGLSYHQAHERASRAETAMRRGRGPAARGSLAVL
jgi:hypothetical protein